MSGYAKVDLEYARRSFVQSQAETMEMYGLNKSVGLLYGSMIFHEKPITLDEMCAETGMSKTSMSTGIRELARLKLVRKVFQPGMRKDLYEVERNQYRSFIDFFTHIWGTAVQLNLQGIAESEEQLRNLLVTDDLHPDDRAEIIRDLGKLEGARQYYNWLRDLSNAFERNEIPVPISGVRQED